MGNKYYTNFIININKNPDQYYIIHYACQNLNDDNETLSPRITSIVLCHYYNGETISFSTYSIAEELNIKRSEVINNFNMVEKELLDRYFEFIKDKLDKFWIHWNMRNLTYGFEHLEHRYKILGGKNIPIIPLDRRINLNDIIAIRYGKNYVKDPKMRSLMEING